MEYDYVIVGAGIFGAVVAQQLVEKNKRVLIIERRAHIGGNIYSKKDPETGIEIHCYGSHIFHTKDDEVWQYINRFAKFNDYVHSVDTRHAGKLYPMPINLDTINEFFGTKMDPAEAEKFVADQAKKSGVGSPQNFEEKAISLVGVELYEAFLKGYTEKQWHLPATKISPDILSRIPIRFTRDNRYFMDAKYQGIPESGYTEIVEKMLASKNISVMLNTIFSEIAEEIPSTVKIIYTGQVDELLDYKLGVLPYRSLEFEEIKSTETLGRAVINEADAEVPYTRSHDFKYYQLDKPEIVNNSNSIIFREYPADYRPGKEAYYPVNNAESEELYQKYVKLAREKYPNLLLGGRLGAYRYWDMDLAIKNALNLVKTIL